MCPVFGRQYFNVNIIQRHLSFIGLVALVFEEAQDCVCPTQIEMIPYLRYKHSEIVDYTAAGKRFVSFSYLGSYISNAGIRVSYNFLF